MSAVTIVAPTAAQTRTIGRSLAALLHPGDVLVVAGEPGAGKTTFTQGLAAGRGFTYAFLCPACPLPPASAARSGLRPPAGPRPR